MDNRLIDLLSEWENRRQAGHPVTAAELLPDDPELAIELEKHIHLLEEFESIGRDSRANVEPPLVSPETETCLAIVAELAKLEVISGEHQRSINSAIAAAKRPLTVDRMMKQLLLADILTPFQVERILAERARDLRVGPYVLLDKIGGGGMGEVFKSRQSMLHREVALKIIRSDLAMNPQATQRFLLEVRTLGRLLHPHVVTAYDAGQDRGTMYLVMEYIDGIDLDRLVRKQGPLSVSEACDFIQQAARGLAAAHAQGIVHRDVKPANLLRDDATGQIKVLDLGLARLVQTESVTRLTNPQQMMGTPDYMSPEQVQSSSNIDSRSDIYSLGCTLYFLLTKRPPFPGDSFLQVVQNHLTSDFPPLKEFRPDVPVPLESLIRDMAAKNPEARPQTLQEVMGRLDHFVRKDWSARDTVLREVPERLSVDSESRFPKRQLRRFATWAAAVVTVIAAVAWFLFSTGRDVDTNSTDRTSSGSQQESTAASVEGTNKAKQTSKARSGPDRWAKAANGRFSAMGSMLASSMQLDWGKWNLVRRGAKLPGLTGWTIVPKSQVGQGGVSCLIADRSRRRIYTGNWSGEVRELDDQGRTLRVLLGHNSAVNSISVSSDGTRLATGCLGGNVRIWELSTGRCPRVFSVGDGVSEVAWSHDGSMLAVSHASIIETRSTDNFAILKRVKDTRIGNIRLAWSKDDSHLVSVAVVDTIQWWNASTLQEVHRVARPGQYDPMKHYHPSALRVSPDGTLVAIADTDGKVRLWNMATYELLKESDSLGGPVHSVAWSPDGSQILGTGPALFFLDSATLQVKSKLPYFSSDHGVDWMTDKQIILNEPHGASVREIKEGGAPFAPTSYARKLPVQSADGQSLIVRVNDQWRFHDTASGDLRQTWNNVPGYYDFASPQGDWVATFNDRTNQLWLVSSKSESERFSLEAHTSTVKGVAWSSDGLRLASLSDDNSLLIWDIARKQLERRVETTGHFRAIALSDDGRHLALAQEAPNQIAILSSESGKVLLAHQMEYYATCVAWLGRDILVGDHGGFARLLHMNGSADAISTEQFAVRRDEVLRQAGARVIAMGATNDRSWLATIGGTCEVQRIGTPGLFDVGSVGISLFWQPSGPKLIAGGGGTDSFRGVDAEKREFLGTLLCSDDDLPSVVISPEGHVRGEHAADQLLYVAQHEDGSQTTHTMPDFVAKFAWKNDPKQAYLLRP